MATQEKVFGSFNFTFASTHNVYCISKTMSKFMFSKMIKLNSKTRKEFNTERIID